MSELQTTELPLWRQRLNQLIAQNPRGMTGVAEQMGISGSYVRRVCLREGRAGRIEPPSVKFIGRIHDAFGELDCPHLQRPLTLAQCKSYNERKYIVIDATTVEHWRACQRCPHNLQNHPSSTGDKP
jgi:hypothetical protein